MCKKDTSGAWGAAVNFGTPLNTEGDEHGLVVSTNGREAYFAGSLNDLLSVATPYINVFALSL